MTSESMRPVVIKIGGSTLGRHDTTLQDLVSLQQRGIPMVVIHGGGKKVTQWLEQRGATTRFVDGLRVTDMVSLEVVAAVLAGLVNTELVAAVNRAGGKACGLTGVDGNLVEARIANPELGYVGTVVGVNAGIVEVLTHDGYIPVIAPPCANASPETADVAYLNVNGDEMAGALAAALNASRLIFLTDVEGIRDGHGRLLARLNTAEVESLIASGVIAGGMIPKAQAALSALSVHCLSQIVDGRVPHALLEAIDGKAAGTTIC